MDHNRKKRRRKQAKPPTDVLIVKSAPGRLYADVLVKIRRNTNLKVSATDIELMRKTPS